MITYNPAFDLYHCIYRMLHILGRLEEGECIDLDKARIWDFYLLFPQKVYGMHMRRDEAEYLKLRKNYVQISNNPYEYSGNNRKLFERLKSYQMTALSNLVSYGVIDRDQFLDKKLAICDYEKFKKLITDLEPLDTKESNVLSFMSLFTKDMSLFGKYGLKQRTKLMESRYDAE